MRHTLIGSITLIGLFVCPILASGEVIAPFVDEPLPLVLNRTSIEDAFRESPSIQLVNNCDTEGQNSEVGGIAWENHQLTTLVLPGGDEGLGLTSVDVRTQFWLKNFPLIRLTPKFAWHFADEPVFTDIPDQLYDFSLDFGFFVPVNEKWMLLGGVAPGMYTDFKNTSSDSIRITGRALAQYKRSDELSLTFGFVYLDRDDVIALPAAGLTYTPAGIPGLKFEVFFPKPKISYQYADDGQKTKTIYLLGEFGGGTWAIERASGVDDDLTYRDLRLALGLEHKFEEDFAWFAEAGFAFSRRIEYSAGGDIDLDNTGMIRAGIRY